MSLDLLVNEYYPVRNAKGDLGVEIECEGRKLPMFDPGVKGNLWKSISDHSLRGESMEYTFSEPYSLERATEALQWLRGHMKAQGTLLAPSLRTSVHVHLNVQRFTLQEVYNIIVAYFLMEALLVQYSGTDRVGNLFCLRGCDAELLPYKIAEGLRKKTYVGETKDDTYRYASLNLAALPKFGSLEFRSFRGTEDFEAIQQWIEVIYTFKRIGHQFNDPLEILRLFEKDQESILDFFPKEFKKEVKGYRDYPQLLQKGYEYAVDICHSGKWLADKTKCEEKKKKSAYALSDDTADALANMADTLQRINTRQGQAQPAFGAATFQPAPREPTGWNDTVFVQAPQPARRARVTPTTNIQWDAPLDLAPAPDQLDDDF